MTTATIAGPPRELLAAADWAAITHGVSTVRSGRRHALGLVFHDA